MIITASHANACQFCTESHCDLVDIAGILDDPLTAIAQPGGLVPRERLAVEYTRAAMADSNAIPADLDRELHERFTDPELVELTFLIGYINMLNLFNNCLQVRYSGEYGVFAPAVG